MEDDDYPAAASNKGDAQVPTTEHEVDPYRTPISDLEAKFQLNLTVEEQERLRLAKETVVPSAGPVQLCAAGHVKCHMVEDRTIVVESVATGGGAPLDEGSLLVIRVENDEADDKQKSQLIPLGKVFEVFGPVSRPLYTIRLPSAKDNQAKTQEKDVTTSVERDADEISLNDDVPEEQAAETAAVEAVECEQSGTVAESRVSDPWAPDGNYKQLLENSRGLPVYYIPDITKLLDTGAIIRNSGRGCDASNLYDEEVINVNDMDFSDDEQEREYKDRNKRGKKGRRKNGGKATSERGRGSGGSGYTGFHAAPPQHATYPPQYATPMMHPPTQYQAVPGAYPYSHPYAYAQHSPVHYVQATSGYVGYPYSYSQSVVPPPPPPYPHEQAQTTPANHDQMSRQPADQASDTVYYD